MRILIADDDPLILRALRILLTARGYHVYVAPTGDAIDKTVEHHPQLVILDLGMPQLNGIDVIEGLRGWTQVPILVISGRTGSTVSVNALDAGADDYVTKPFAADELLARIRALTRRTRAVVDDPVVRFGFVTVNLATRQASKTSDGGTVRLTPTEWLILGLLLRNPRRLVTRQSLLAEVWGPQYTNDPGYLRLYVAQLRKKLEPVPSQPQYLLTEHGMGYRFTPDPE